MSEPMTMERARELNALGISTGGCWRCIQAQGPKGKTQWETASLKFIGHRQFCPEHYIQEYVDARGF
ncbi:MAG: hypothetical protein KGH74_03640 [Candidatus Micrarchaeota archaeon]|nr:hypothetical protein [Candidatus Micrarchaeota archaeon]